MDILFLKVQFVFLLFLYLFAFYKLIKQGFSFSLGFIYGILYFIFIPLIVFVFTNEVEISKIDFWETNIIDIELRKNFSASLLLIGYLYSFLVYYFLSEFLFIRKKHQKINLYKPVSLNLLLFLWVALLVFSVVLSGALSEGGHWYKSRHLFQEESGMFGTLVLFLFQAIKLMLIARLIFMFRDKEIKYWRFGIISIFFIGVDIFFTGNRIFAFILLAGISIVILQRYRLRSLFFGVLVIPFGYLMSVYQRIRGQLFVKGIPSISDTLEIIKDTVRNHPPQITEFLLGISESVNFNVLYMIFNSVTPNNMLLGETFAKLFTYFIPRSFWKDKPLSITQVAGEWFAPQAEHLSLVTTLIGELHMNFSLLGILIFPLILFCLRYIGYYLSRDNNITSVILFLFGILFFRMSFSDVFLVLLFVVVISSLIKLVTLVNNVFWQRKY